MNLYAFVDNIPTNRIDYKGTQGRPTTVSNLDQAVDYFRANYGGTVAATDSVDAEIKQSLSYMKMLARLKLELMVKLKEVDCGRTSGIIRRPGGDRGVTTGTKTVGSVLLRIKPYRIHWIAWAKSPRDNERAVSGRAFIEFEYSDIFRFEWDKKKPIKTIATDVVPGMIAGSGTNFTIEGKFVEDIDITTSQCCSR